MNCMEASSTPGTLGRLYPLSNNLFVSATGNVGIGTITPDRSLHLKTSGHPLYMKLDSTAPTPSVGLEIAENGVGKCYIQREAGNRLAFYSGSATPADVVILDNGRVGIGTTADFADAGSGG